MNLIPNFENFSSAATDDDDDSLKGYSIAVLAKEQLKPGWVEEELSAGFLLFLPLLPTYPRQPATRGFIRR